MDFKNLKPFSR